MIRGWGLRRTAVTAVMALAASAATVAGDGGTALAEPRAAAPAAGVARPAASAGPAQAQDAASARSMARLQHRGIEVLGDRTDASQTFVNADGTMTYTAFAEPKWVKRGGTWADLDATLTLRADGTVRPATAESGLVLSGGGSGPLMSMTVDGRTMSLSWPSALPVPALSGATATYGDVLDGVDLRVTATPQGGAEETLVVRTAAAAADPRLSDLVQTVATGTGTTAVTDAGGNLTVKDSGGRLLVNSPAPAMWDSATGADGKATTTATVTSMATAPGTPSRSTDRGPGPRAHRAAVRASLKDHSLRLVPDRGLLSRKDTVFPVYIDPAYVPHPASGSTLHYDLVQQALPASSNYDIPPAIGNGAGLEAMYPPTGIERTYYQVGIPSKIWDGHVLSASMKFTEENSASCAATTYAVQTWSTNPISASTTWNNAPAKVAEQSSVNFGPACTTTPSGTFSFMNQVTNAAANHWSNITFVLVNSSETNSAQYKQFANPSLSITYNTPPATPTNMSFSPAGGLWGTVSSTGTPTFSAQATDADSDTVRLDYQVLSHTTVVASGSSAFVTSGTAGTWKPSTAVPDGSYTWQVRAYDGADYSAWSTGQLLRIDTATCGGATGGLAPTDLQVGGLSTGAPVLSGIVRATAGGAGILTGNIYLVDSSGQAVGGSPTATGTAPSGSRVSWRVPPGVLTAGGNYTWSMGTPDACVMHTTAGPAFTVPTDTSVTAPTGPGNATIGGPALAITSAAADSTSAPASGAPFSVGGDGTNQWVAALKADLSAIPAGSAIDTATLTMNPAGCLGSCAADTVTIGQATSDVSAAATGTDLAAVSVGASYTASQSAGTYDVTTLVGAWTTGAVPNDGLLLTGTASGEAYSGASLHINYTPPTVPSAPQSLTLTPGDGGVIAGWAQPSSTGYLDPSGDADGLTAYHVTVTGPGGTVAATTTTTDTSAVLTGLTNATGYTVSVTAENPVGTGAAATGSATPQAVPGGKQQYLDAVSQFLNARDSLQTGSTTTVAAATAGDSQQAAITGWLSDEVSADTAMATYATSVQQQETDDATTLSNQLVALDPTGSTVNVYATADETFTTVDTSTGTAQSVPGQETDAVEYSFSAGGSPAITQYTDADAVVVPVSAETAPTAYSAVLDNLTGTTPDGVGVDSTGTHFTDPPAGTVRPMAHYGNRTGIKNWADAHWNGSYNGFSDDCTDFASRAMHSGGKMPENVPISPILSYKNDAYWFQYKYWYGYTQTSYSWAGAVHLANYQSRQGAWFIPYASWVSAGDLIFANWSGGGFSGITHTGVVAAVTSHNIYIDQHSNKRYHEPLWKAAGYTTWQGSNPRLSVWVAEPYERN